MGLRSFSMHPSQIVTIKERILATDASRWAAAIERVIGADDPERECTSRSLPKSTARVDALVTAVSAV